MKVRQILGYTVLLGMAAYGIHDYKQQLNKPSNVAVEMPEGHFDPKTKKMLYTDTCWYRCNFIPECSNKDTFTYVVNGITPDGDSINKTIKIATNDIGKSIKRCVR